MRVSVVIPTLGNPEGLQRTLASLQAQRPADAEVLVVDNGPTDETEAVARASRGPLPVRYIPEPELGLQHARHAGVRAATGELLCFIDDDATAAPGWIAAHVAAFVAHPEIEAAGGSVLPEWEEPPPPWLERYIAERGVVPVLALIKPADRVIVAPDVPIAGVNLAVRRRVFEQTGFHPELIGPRTIGDGESGLLRDILEAGGKIAHVPDAVVHHTIPARRMTPAYFRRWAGHLAAAVMFQRWHLRRRRPAKMLLELGHVAARHGRSLVRFPRASSRTDARSLFVQLDTFVALRRAQYLWWMLTDDEVQRGLDTRDFRP